MNLMRAWKIVLMEVGAGDRIKRYHQLEVRLSGERERADTEG